MTASPADGETFGAVEVREHTTAPALVWNRTVGESPVPPTAADRFAAWWNGAADNTRRAVIADPATWQRFCRARGAAVVPSGALNVRDFVLAQAAAGLRAASIARQLASVAMIHRCFGVRPTPVEDEIVGGTMKQIRREQAQAGRGRPAQAAALRRKGDVEDLDNDPALPLSVVALVSTLDLARTSHLRDAVFLQVGSDLGRRRSELAALNVGDVVSAADGSGTALIRQSKTDQDGAGAVKYLSPSAMRAIRAWLERREIISGAVVVPAAPLLTSIDRWGRIGKRLSADGVRRLVRDIARRGLRELLPAIDENELERRLVGLSGHSFRVGLAQDLTAAGEGLPAINSIIARMIDPFHVAASPAECCQRTSGGNGNVRRASAAITVLFSDGLR